MAYNFVRSNVEYLAGSLFTSVDEPLTIAAMARSTDTSLVQTIVAVYDNSDTSHHRIIVDGGLNRIQAQSYVGTIVSANSPATLVQGAWANTAGVFVGDTQRRAVLDGAAGANNTTSRIVGARNLITIGIRLIGALAAQGFQGDLAEVAIWSATLTPGELLSLSRGFKPVRVRPQSLVYYAPLVRDTVELRGGTSLGGVFTAGVAHPRVY
jgi:hypothetical protein